MAIRETRERQGFAGINMLPTCGLAPPSTNNKMESQPGNYNARSNRQEMLDACSTGDISKLEKLLDAVGVSPGFTMGSDPPPAHELLR